MKLVKTDDSDFRRDETNNALINTNVNAYLIYKQKREANKIASLNIKKINDLEKEIQQLKELVIKLAEGKNG